MALTTSEQIQQQLAIIFGFSNGKGIEVGDIIGIGKLSESRQKVLVDEMLLYLNSFNAMLRDYAGSEIYAIEFELERIDGDKSHVDILPQAMLFVPGEYKECTSLLLLLSNELSLLDNTKAHEDLDEISTRFFEIEEIVQRPEFNDEQKAKILRRFAQRFSRSLQAAAIEHKWDKKLIGLKDNEELEQFNRRQVLNIERKTLFMDDNSLENSLDNARVSTIKLNVKPNDAWEAFKRDIQPSSLEFILKNTMKLTTKLMNISNTGTINDAEYSVINKIMDFIYKEVSKNEGLKSLKWMMDEIQKYNVIFSEEMNNHKLGCQEFLKTILNKPLNVILEEYVKFHEMRQSEHPEIRNLLSSLCLDQIKNNEYSNPESVLINELTPTFHYVEEIVKFSWKTIRQSVPKFFYFYIMQEYSNGLKETLISKLNVEKNPSLKSMGEIYANNLLAEINNNVNQRIIVLPITYELDEAEVYNDFKMIARQALDTVLEKKRFSIRDLVGISVNNMGENLQFIKDHVEKFKTFEDEMTFLLRYIMRHSSFNKFIQEIPEDTILTPTVFAEEYAEALRKKMGALSMKWKDYMVDLIRGFGTNIQSEYEQAIKKRKYWSNHEIIMRFIKYITDLVNEQTQPEKFREVLDNYSKNILDMKQNFGLREFKTNFSEALASQKDIISIIEMNFREQVNNFGFRLRPLNPNKYIKETSETADTVDFSFESTEEHTTKVKINTLMDYIKYRQLPYYSKLAAKPTKIVFKSLDKGQFFEDLIRHKLIISYFEHSIKVNYSNNYFEVRPKF